MDIPPDRVIIRPDTNFKWAIISSLVIVTILTISALGTAIAAREGKLAANSVGNKIIRNSDRFVFRGVTVEGNTTLGENASDTLTINADVDSHIIPDQDSTYDLGSTSKRWGTIYADNVIGASVSAGVCSITADDAITVSPLGGTGAVTLGLSIAPSKGLSITTSGLSVVLGSGLDFVDGGICVQIGEGLSFDGNTIKTTGVAAGVSTISAGDGINVDKPSGNVTVGISGGEGICVSAAGVSVLLEDKVGLSFGINGGLSVQLGNGLDFINGGISVQLGTGLEFTPSGISVTTSGGGIPAIQAGNSGVFVTGNDTVGLSIVPNTGLSIINGEGLSVQLGNGLDFINGGISVQLGTGLEFTPSGISVTVGGGGGGIPAIQAGNSGVFVTDNDTVGLSIVPNTGLSIINGEGLSVQLGNGLDFINGGISVQLGTGLEFTPSGISVTTSGGGIPAIQAGNSGVFVTDNDTVGLSIVPNTGLSIINGEGLSVQLGNGLDFINGGISVQLGTGLEFTPSGISVTTSGGGIPAIQAGNSGVFVTGNDTVGLSIVPNTGLSIINGEGLSVQLGNGLDFINGGISVQLGTGLEFTPSGISVTVGGGGGGIPAIQAGNSGVFVTDNDTVGLSIVPNTGLSIINGEGLSVQLGNGLDFINGGISVQLGTGLEFTPSGISVTTSGGGIPAIQAGNSGVFVTDNDTVGLSIVPNTGLSIINGEGLSVQLGNGLDFINGGISVQLGTGLEFTPSGISVTTSGGGIPAIQAGNSGIVISGTDNDTVGLSIVPNTGLSIINGEGLSVQLGNGLDFINGGISVQLGTGLEFTPSGISVTVGGDGGITAIQPGNSGIVISGTDNDTVGLSIVPNTGLSIINGEGLSVQLGNGLDFINGGISVQLGTGLEFTPSGISVTVGGDGGITAIQPGNSGIVISGTDNDTVGLSIVPNTGLSIINGEGLSVQLGNGLDFINGGISVQLGTGLEFTPSGISVTVGGDGGITAIQPGNSGIVISGTDNDTVGLSIVPNTGLSIINGEGLSVQLSKGLDFTSEGISVQLGTGLEFTPSGISVTVGGDGGITAIQPGNSGIVISGTDNDTVGLSIVPNTGLSIINGEGLSVQLSKGLDFTSEGISVQLGSGLEFNGIAIKVIDEHNLGVSTITNINGGLTLTPPDGTSSSVDIGLSLLSNGGLGISNSSLRFSNTGLATGSTATGLQALILNGNNNTASGQQALIISGNNNNISGAGSVLTGINHIISGNNSIILSGVSGNISSDLSGIILGTNHIISENNSIALNGAGLSTFNSRFQECVLAGRYNDEGLSEMNASNNGVSFRFIVASGTESDRKNAFTVDDVGNLYFGTEAGASIYSRQSDNSFAAINTDANVNSVTASDDSIIIGSSTGDVTLGVSVNTSAGLSITSDGLSVQLGSGLLFDSSGGISVQLNTGLDFDNGLIFNPPHAKMVLFGASQTVPFNTSDTITFNRAFPTNSYLSSNSFLPPVDGYYNSAVHLFNGASSATSGTVIALQENGGNVLQRFKTFGLDDISFSSIQDLSSGSSYSLTVESGGPIELVLGSGYSEWSVNYIAKS